MPMEKTFADRSKIMKFISLDQTGWSANVTAAINITCKFLQWCITLQATIVNHYTCTLCVETVSPGKRTTS